MVRFNISLLDGCPFLSVFIKSLMYAMLKLGLNYFGKKVVLCTCVTIKEDFISISQFHRIIIIVNNKNIFTI